MSDLLIFTPISISLSIYLLLLPFHPRVTSIFPRPRQSTHHGPMKYRSPFFALYTHTLSLVSHSLIFFFTQNSTTTTEYRNSNFSKKSKNCSLDIERERKKKRVAKIEENKCGARSDERDEWETVKL